MADSLDSSRLWAGLWALTLLSLSIFCTRRLIFGGLDRLTGRSSSHHASQPKALSKLRTIRIREIPIGTTKESMLNQLKKLVGEDPELNAMLDKANLSRCTLVRRSAQHACSTLEVNSSLSAQSIVDKFNKLARVLGFKFDCDFRGITPLFEDDGNATVDVVAVPGLASHPVGSWTLSDGSGDFWLRDFLPCDIPNARVLIYGYDSKLHDSRLTENIETMGGALLQSLKGFRASTQTSSRPIIFVVHSLGGLILKETLLKAHEKRKDDDRCRAIADGCYAILMFGVPNTGLRNREQLQKIVKGQPNESLINDLVVDRSGQPQAYLRGLTTRFAMKCEDRYKVVCFYETKFSPTVQRQENGRLANTGEEMLLVSIESATNVGLTTVRHQYNINLQKDHSGLCKLDRIDDYETVLERLKPLVEEASSGITITMPRPGDRHHLENIRNAIPTSVPPLYTRISKRFPDTTWLFENRDYCQWIHSNSLGADSQALITLRGGLGSGKTVLMERALQEAVASNASVNIWHSFDSSKRQGDSRLMNSHRGLLISIFAQLLDRVEQKPWHKIRQLGQDLGGITDEHFEDLITSLLVLNKTTVDSGIVTYRFFIDALEQCSSTDPELGSKLDNVDVEMKKILHFLTDSIALRGTDGLDIRVCVSRRHTPTFGHLEPSTAVIKLEDHVGPLVKAFLETKLAKLSDMTLFHYFFPRLQGRVLNGYLWASFVLERIKADASSSRGLDRSELIKQIPDEMGKMYEYVLDTLDASYDPRAIRLLQIVLVAAVPMTINQLRHALGFTEEFPFSTVNEWERSGSSEPTDKNFVACLNELTSGLLTASPLQISPCFEDEEELFIRPIAFPQDVLIVSFAHSTTRTFLCEAAKKGSNALAMELVDNQSHLTLLVACFRALEIFGSEEDTEGLTFINYACELWLKHANGSDDLLVNIDRKIIPSFILQCTNVTTLLLERQMKLLQRSHAKEHLVLGQPEAGLMVYAATFGCTNLIRMHLEECRSCSDLTSPQVQMTLSTALRSSITHHHHETTEYLLSVYCKAAGSLEDDGYLLYKACYAEDIKTVKSLLVSGANPSVRHTRGYELPLHVAIAKGHKDIVALLLKSAKPDAHTLLTQKRSRSGMTALHFVIDVQRPWKDRVDVLDKMLPYIPKGSPLLDMEDGNGETPLDLVRRMVADKKEGSWRLEASLPKS